MSHFAFRPEFIAGIAHGMRDFSPPGQNQSLTWGAASLFPLLMKLNGQTCNQAAHDAFAQSLAAPCTREGAAYLYSATGALLANAVTSDSDPLLITLKLFRDRMVHVTLENGISPSYRSDQERLSQFVQDYLALSRDGHRVYQDGDWPIRKVTDHLQTQAGSRTLHGEQYLMKLAAENDPLRVISPEIHESGRFPYPAELAESLGISADKIPKAHALTALRFHGAMIRIHARVHDSLIALESADADTSRIEALSSKLDKAVHTHGHLCMQTFPICHQGFGMTYQEVEKALAKKSQAHALSIPDEETDDLKNVPRPDL